MKTAVENDIFWSEIWSGFGEPDGTPMPRIPRSAPSRWDSYKPAAVVVSGLLMLAILITVLPVHKTLFSTSAKPNPSLHTVFPSTLTAIDTPGMPHSSFVH